MKRAPIALFALLAGAPRVARACSTCGCGDPTVTGVGVEKPYAGRLRGSLELQHRTDDVGQPRVDALRLVEERLNAQASFSPYERATVLLTVPLLQRRVGYVNLAETVTRGLGDVELRAKLLLFEDRRFAPHHLLAATIGVKLPTGPVVRGDDGALLPVEMQPGTGSWDPLAGLSYAHFRPPWSSYVSVQGGYPTRGRGGFRASRSLRATALVQRQLGNVLGLRAGLDGRLDGKSIEAGAPARDSSGAIGFGDLDLLVSATPNLLLFVSAKVPVVQALAGYHREGPLVSVGVAYDY